MRLSRDQARAFTILVVDVGGARTHHIGPAQADPNHDLYSDVTPAAPWLEGAGVSHDCGLSVDFDDLAVDGSAPH